MKANIRQSDIDAAKAYEKARGAYIESSNEEGEEKHQELVVAAQNAASALLVVVNVALAMEKIDKKRESV